MPDNCARMWSGGKKTFWKRTIVETFYRRRSKTKISNIYGIDIEVSNIWSREKGRSFESYLYEYFPKEYYQRCGRLRNLPRSPSEMNILSGQETLCVYGSLYTYRKCVLVSRVTRIDTYRTRPNNYSSKSKLFLKSRIEERRKKKRDVSRKLKGVYAVEV